MSKHHHKGRKEQIVNRTHDAQQLQQDKIHYQKRAPMESADIQEGAENESKTNAKEFS